MRLIIELRYDVVFKKIIKNMSRNFSIVLIIFSLALNGCDAQSKTGSLKLTASIPLPGVSGRIDHLSIDYTHQIIFVAALGNNSVEVVDLKTKKVIHSIKGLHEPQGVAYISESNAVFVANGDNGECDVFNAATFQKINSLALPGDADNVRYDSVDKKIYVGYGNGGIAIIDAANFKLINEIKFPGHPESFQLDKVSKKIYLNVPDEEQIEVIDLNKNAVVEKWKMNDATSNFPMALDEAHHRLFVGCRHSPTLLIIDTQTGKTITSFSIDGDTDDIFYNAAGKEIYVSCGEGFVDVFRQSDANTYASNGRISTNSGARTSLFDTGLNQLIVASPMRFGRNASLLIYTITK